MKDRRSVSVPIIRPLACAFGLNEAVMSSGSELRTARRKARNGMVDVHVPRKLEKSLTYTNNYDNDSLFKFGKSAWRHRGMKKRLRNKQASAKTFQTGSLSSSSESGIGTKACSRLPRAKSLSKKLSSRKKKDKVNGCIDDFIISASSSSSSWTHSSGNEASRETSVDGETEVRDKYDADSYEDIFYSRESLRIQDCYEERDTLVLQLHIPTQQTPHQVESLDVQYLPFKIPTLKTEMA